MSRNPNSDRPAVPTYQSSAVIGQKERNLESTQQFCRNLYIRITKCRYLCDCEFLVRIFIYQLFIPQTFSITPTNTHKHTDRDEEDMKTSCQMMWHLLAEPAWERTDSPPPQGNLRFSIFTLLRMMHILTKLCAKLHFPVGGNCLH